MEGIIAPVFKIADLFFSKIFIHIDVQYVSFCTVSIFSKFQIAQLAEDSIVDKGNTGLHRLPIFVLIILVFDNFVPSD